MRLRPCGSAPVPQEPQSPPTLRHSFLLPPGHSIPGGPSLSGRGCPYLSTEICAFSVSNWPQFFQRTRRHDSYPHTVYPRPHVRSQMTSRPFHCGLSKDGRKERTPNLSNLRRWTKVVSRTVTNESIVTTGDPGPPTNSHSKPHRRLSVPSSEGPSWNNGPCHTV